MDMVSFKDNQMCENPFSPSGGQRVLRAGVQEVISVICPRWTLSDTPVIAEWEWDWESFLQPSGQIL